MAATTLLRSSANRALWSASAIVCKPVTDTHVLRVDGYSHLSQVISNGKHVKSSTFDIGSHGWYLRLYPNGDFSFERQISAIIFLASNLVKDEGVWAKAKFSFLDRLGNPGLVKEIPLRSLTKGQGWGFGDLVSREDLEKSEEYLNNDGFAIQCDVTVTTVRQHRDHMAFIAPNTKHDATLEL